MNPDITLYHCADARSFRALWALEEMQLPYRLEMLPFPPRLHRPEYLELNPLGTIPLLLDGSTRMTESSAIVEYLVTRYGPTPLAVRPDEPDYGAFLNGLHFGEATLTFPQTLVLRYATLEPEGRRNPQVAEDYTRWFLSRARVLESTMARQDFCCADRFTAADISIGYALLLAHANGIAAHFKPATRAYWERLQDRDGYRRARAAQAKEMTDAVA